MEQFLQIDDKIKELKLRETHATDRLRQKEMEIEKAAFECIIRPFRSWAWPHERAQHSKFRVIF